MAKKRNVEVLTTKINSISEDLSDLSFADILDFINGKKYILEYGDYQPKEYEFRLLDTTLENCKVGIVETMQTKDLPPKKNISTKRMSSLEINPDTERLVFGNVFLYDIKRNVFIYEVNKNGCYPDKFSHALSILLSRYEFEKSKKINISFPSISRKHEYERVLRMSYYKRIRAEILKPAELLKKLNEQEDSLKNNLIKENLSSGAHNNADTVIIEQNALTKKINPEGLSRSKVIEFVDTCIALSKDHVTELSIKGYYTDPESPKSTRNIDLLTDVFKESFQLTDVQLQSDLQQGERVLGIENLYNRILPEIREIIGY